MNHISSVYHFESQLYSRIYSLQRYFVKKYYSLLLCYIIYDYDYYFICLIHPRISPIAVHIHNRILTVYANETINFTNYQDVFLVNPVRNHADSPCGVHAHHTKDVLQERDGRKKRSESLFKVLTKS